MLEQFVHPDIAELGRAIARLWDMCEDYGVSC